MARIRQTAFGALLLVIAIGGTTVLWAQSAVLPASVVTASPTEVSDANTVRLLVGRSTVVDVGTAVARVSLTSPEIADALVTSPNQLLVNGKLPGTISMFVWDRSNALRRYEIIVQRDLARLSEQVRQLFPGESIDVYSNGKNIVLSGQVSNKDVIEKAINVAAGYVDKREEVVPLLQIRDGAPSNQVLLRVRFAEVSRSAMTELGASLFTGANGYNNRFLGRTTTEQFGNNPVFDNSGDTPKLVFSDFLNLFLFDSKNQLGTVIKALQSKGQFQSLAEPNLVAESGKEASFLAGGEFPVPIATGTGANMSISVTYKEFGIRLTFTPTVIGDRVHLKVRPEVSTLDYGNAVVLSGFRIPALSTRRTETELELQNLQTFAIAGLMDNSVSSTMQKMPGIGDIPILGLLFKSKAAQKNQTELVVMITPEILPNNSHGVTPNLPRTPEPFLPPIDEKHSLPAPPQSFSGQSAAPVMAARPAAPVQATTASSAAAAVSNLMPSSTPRLQGADAVGASAPMNVSPIAAPMAVSPSASPMAVSPGAAPVSSSSAAAPAASASSSPASTPPNPAVKPLSDKDLKAAEKKRQAEEEKANKAAQDQARVDARKKAEDDKRQAQQAEANRQAEARQQERDAKAAKEQAKRDAEAAKKAEDAAKHQSELDRENRKSLDTAAAKLKAAEAAYTAELARTQQQ